MLLNKKLNSINNMIKLSYLLIFALAILFFTSCERGTSDADSVRIRQIANNSDFGNPLYEFEYGNDGMLSRIIELYGPAIVSRTFC